jgi:hypothetical protein
LVQSSVVKAFESAPIAFRASLYAACGNFSVPRNIMCSKKWAKPLWPGSTSWREPVRTTV